MSEAVAQSPKDTPHVACCGAWELACRQVPRSVLLAHGMMLAAGLILLAGFVAWRRLLDYAAMRTTVLTTEIFVGFGAAMCLAGAIHYLDQPLVAGAQPAWYLRLPLKAYKRVLLVGQILVTALAVASVIVMVFRAPIPYPPDGRLIREDGRPYVKDTTHHVYRN